MKPRPIRCPRCGYDLKGAVESWRDACPLSGRCPECGLVIDWREILSDELAVPRWFIEGGRWIGLAAVRTLAMTANPWRFWRDVRMTHPLRPWRLLAYGLILLALAYAIFAAGHGTIAYRHHERVTRGQGTISVGPLQYAAQAAALPFSARSRATYRHPRWPTGMVSPMRSPRKLLDVYGRSLHSAAVLGAFVVVVWLLSPLGFVALPVSRRMARVRQVHLLRITAYAAPFMVLALAWIYVRMVLAVNPMYRQWKWDEPPALLGADVLYPVVLIVWWGTATSRYLRMRHPWGVAVAMVVIAWLAAYGVRVFTQLQAGLV